MNSQWTSKNIMYSIISIIVAILTLLKPLIQHTKMCVGRFMHPHHLKTITDSCSMLSTMTIR